MSIYLSYMIIDTFVLAHISWKMSSKLILLIQLLPETSGMRHSIEN